MSLFGFGKKKEDEKSVLPELPTSKEDLELPSINDLPQDYFNTKKDDSVLPSLPDSELSNKSEQTPIKQIIKEPEKGMQKSKFDYAESVIPQIKSEQINKIPLKPFKNTEIVETKIIENTMVKKAEPIFVRLDKFQATVQAFNEIKDKIDDIEEVLRKTKEIRAKEEQEIEKWEREIQLIKARIDAVDKNMFQGMD